VAATGLVPTIRVNLLLRDAQRGNVARRAVSGDNSCSHPIGPHPLVPIYFHQSPRAPRPLSLQALSVWALLSDVASQRSCRPQAALSAQRAETDARASAAAALAAERDALAVEGGGLRARLSCACVCECVHVSACA
jgi:hypothetical protein